MKYEDRPVIPFETYVLADDEIHITTKHTGLTHIRNKNPIELAQYVKNVKTLRKIAKEHNVKVSGLIKQKQYVIKHYDAYIDEVMEYRKQFSKLKQAWVGHTVHNGMSDDTYYYETIQPLYSNLLDKQKRSTLLSAVEDKNNNLLKWINTIPNSTYTKISV